MYIEEEKEIGAWVFNGSAHWDAHNMDTYSCGIFQWIPSKSGKPKASVIAFRVKGNTGETTAADIAQKYCEVLNGYKFSPEDAFVKVFLGKKSIFYRKGDRPKHLDQLLADLKTIVK